MAGTTELGSGGLKLASRMGFGCMGMTFGYANDNPGTEEEYIKLLRAVIEAGCMLDTSDVYGPHTNEILVGKALRGIPREQVMLATKFGLYFKPDGSMGVRGDPGYVRTCCEASLERLGTTYIDLYYMHRKDPDMDIVDTMRELQSLVQEGKIRHIGLSEVTPQDLRRAHAVHPIAAVQLEWSLWTRDAEKDLIPVCRELGIGIVAYSPLGRGFFTGTIKPDQLPEKDSRRSMPRFSQDAWEKNTEILNAVKKLADAKGCTPGQLALAWLLAQGPDVVPIPGTKREAYFKENMAALQIMLSPAEVQELTAVADPSKVVGERYGAAHYKARGLQARHQSSAAVGRLNHVAIAVPDLAAAADKYRSILGVTVSEPQPVPEHGVTVVFVQLENTKLELMAPLGDNSPIANFLTKNPQGGMHHMCLEVEDIKASMDAVAPQARLLSDKPKIGAHGTPVVFVHPKDMSGVLTELEQVGKK